MEEKGTQVEGIYWWDQKQEIQPQESHISFG